jgi:hypothetical protein
MEDLKSWSGVIFNSGCTPDEAFAEAAKCTENGLPLREGGYDTAPQNNNWEQL